MRFSRRAARAWVFTLVAVAGLVCSIDNASATIVLPGNAGDRTTLINLIKELCKDFNFTATQNAAGEWVLVKEPLGTHKTPVGCDEICRLMDANCKVTLEVNKGVVVGSTRPADPKAASNGTGSDSTVSINPGDTAYYFDSAGNKHKASTSSVLAHELCHAEDNWLGLRGDNREKNAIDLWENPVHRENGEPEREGHRGTTDPAC